MIRYHIRVNNGDNNITKKYEFIHKDWKTKSEEEQGKDWQKAIDDINYIYEKYGRFATSTGVIKFFKEHNFELTIS